MTRFKSVKLALICNLAFTCIASGNAILVYNTGESSGLTALSIGQSNPNYNIVSAPSGVPLGAAITTAANPNWLQNTSTTDWISPGSSGLTNWAGGNYDYQTTFSLAGLNPSTAELTGSWASDNGGCIYLNGTNTGNCTAAVGGFKSLVAFTITTGFQAGVNVLDFIVNNGANSPTGVFIDISGTASSGVILSPQVDPVPEPSAFPTLLGIGLVGFAAVFRHGRKSHA
ncbi:MAG TPA: PEP-CTERM sorting domain-containing protein [Bryobacteraceae bacterium]|nr:PEP-CTERM sorting domain-containing protein [Bryobacteraceae bacterium]